MRNTGVNGQTIMLKMNVVHAWGMGIYMEAEEVVCYCLCIYLLYKEQFTTMFQNAVLKVRNRCMKFDGY